MVNKELMENVSRLGFPLMEAEQDFNANATLAQVVKSGDTRLWEGFPVLVANAAQAHSWNYDRVMGYLDHQQEKETFQRLLLMSLAVYDYFHLSYSWTNALNKKMAGPYAGLLSRWKKAMADDKALEVQNKSFQAGRVKEVFLNYFEKNAQKAKEQRQKSQELSLEYALSQVFSPKQKELFKKKLSGEPFTKTEREYYSRAVKKKVAALANPDVHRLAQKLLG